jgi:hypothetical protein
VLEITLKKTRLKFVRAYLCTEIGDVIKVLSLILAF